ncbi:MAG: hypothetical protein ABL925_01240 [Methylococcales bacterium]
MIGFRSRGFVIPLVLIIISILVVLSMGLSHLARNQIKTLQHSQTQWQSELIYRSVLHKLMHNLLIGKIAYNYVQSELRLPIDGRTFTMDGVEVQIQDTAGLMGLGAYQEAQLYQLLLQLTDLETAQRISHEFTDWVDKNNLQQRYGMEADNYIQAELPYQPRNKMIRSLDELLELPSMTLELYNGSAQQPGLRNFLVPGIGQTLNAATAPQPVMRAMLKASTKQWQAIWAARSAENWSLLEKLLRDFPGAFGDLGPFMPANTFRVIMKIPEQKAMRVVFSLTPGRNPPYAIQQWYYPDDDRG